MKAVFTGAIEVRCAVAAEKNECLLRVKVKVWGWGWGWGGGWGWDWG